MITDNGMYVLIPGTSCMAVVRWTPTPVSVLHFIPVSCVHLSAGCHPYRGGHGAIVARIPVSSCMQLGVREV